MELDHACKIQLNEDIFGRRRSVFLFQEDIYAFSKIKIIGQNCLAIYISYLQSDLKNKNWTYMYGFIDPNDFSFECGKSDKRATMLSARLKDANEDQIFLVPYNAECFDEYLRLIIGIKHWMLVAIDPYNNKAYYMDSMSKKVPLNLKECVKLPRQPGGTECGYYVMRFMKDVIQNHILITSEKDSYNKDDIDVMRNEWALHLGSLIM
ncbi:hypothetical protein UlMin_018989 [Ulmus minor]